MPTLLPPKMIRVRQRFERPRVDDLPRVLSERLQACCKVLPIKSNASVAVACSSRGLARYPEIVRTTVSSLKDLGLEPFLVPSMGSHGAASAEGQQRVLEHLGLDEASTGAPIRSSLEVVELGKAAEGVPVVVDKLAYEADHIVLINRIKKHTDFMGAVESGLLKLMAIGLGKAAGAEIYHQAMMSLGSSEVILAVARRVLKTCPVLFGVATIENGYGEVADIGVFAPEEIESREKAFLARAREIAPSLPFDEGDILHIDEIGKEISGAGFDTRVVGRIRLPGTPEPEKPKIKRLILSDITAASEGNATGFGLADIITRRLADQVDAHTTDTNTIISLALEMGKTPLIMPNDREAMALAMKSVGLTPPHKQKIMRIQNTLELIEVEVSEAYLEAIKENPRLEIINPAQPMTFGLDGYFLPFTPKRVP